MRQLDSGLPGTRCRGRRSQRSWRSDRPPQESLILGRRRRHCPVHALGQTGSFAPGTPLLEAARSLGVDIDSVCGGRGLCGRCQVSCVSGSFAKHQIESDVDHLSPFSTTEEKFNERKGPLKPGRRLSCHTRLLDDVVIDVPAESQVHRQIVRKAMSPGTFAWIPQHACTTCRFPSPPWKTRGVKSSS